MTRKSAIRLLLGAVSGFLVKSANSQNKLILSNGRESLAVINFGDPVKRTDAEKAVAALDYKRCLASVKEDGTMRFGCEDPDSPWRTDFIPGTATLTVNLDGWKWFEVTSNGKTIQITRQEIWEALQ